jgi:Tol biopolymer transport system component
VFSPVPTGIPDYRIANATTGVWSPTRDVHLLTGNRCGADDLFLFDPENVTLSNLTKGDNRPYALSYAWAPDGVRVAASARDGDHDALVLIDTISGAITTIAETEGRADVRPLAWSPDGQRLLFHAWRGTEYACPPGEYPVTYLDTVPNLGGP